MIGTNTIKKFARSPSNYALKSVDSCQAVIAQIIRAGRGGAS